MATARARTDDGELLEALDEATRGDGGEVRCYQALARVDDDEPTYVFNDGPSNGMTVSCTILTGPFVGSSVTAMVAGPLGGGLEVSPLRPGQRVHLALYDGRVDGLIGALAGMPGGREDPLPSVIAGVPLTSEGLEDQGSAAANGMKQPRAKLIAPPKGIGIREYLRGAIRVTRLKGLQDDFFSGFVVSADDGSSIEMRWNSLDQSYLTEIKDKTGVRLAVGGGFASLSDKEGTAMVQVSKGKVFIQADQVVVNGSTCTQIDGGAVLVGLAGKPPTPLNACAIGVAGPANVVSTTVFVGGLP